jgi:hypothetical protein
VLAAQNLHNRCCPSHVDIFHVFTSRTGNFPVIKSIPACSMYQFMSTTIHIAFRSPHLQISEAHEPEENEFTRKE